MPVEHPKSKNPKSEIARNLKLSGVCVMAQETRDSAPDLPGRVGQDTATLRMAQEIAFRLCAKVDLKHKSISGVDLGPLPKTSPQLYANIAESEKPQIQDTSGPECFR